MVCYRISVRLEQLAKRLPASLEGSKTLRRFDTDHSCPPFVLSFSCAFIYKWFHFHGLVEISPAILLFSLFSIEHRVILDYEQPLCKYLLDVIILLNVPCSNLNGTDIESEC